MRIQDHRLSWRWTDPQYAVLPDSVLERMTPINTAQASDYLDLSLTLLGKDGLSDDIPTQSKIDTQHLKPEAGTKWLLNTQPIQGTTVVLSWDRENAISTEWNIFARYWNEFCYPSSDDLVVFPKQLDWVFLYHHEEEFHFGTIPTTSKF